jgi:hypothetical protein
MITIGNKKVKVINPTQIVHLELIKGKTTVFVKGDTDGDDIVVNALSVREPWTVVVKTTIDTHYVNCRDFEEALRCLLDISRETLVLEDRYASMKLKKLEKDLRKIYGQEKET